MTGRLSTSELHARFVEAVGGLLLADATTDPQGELVVTFASPLSYRMRVYIHNATNPPGGRPTREHKIQLIMTGQSKGERANLDWSGVDYVLLCGYVSEGDIFVLWDATMHINFPHSRNLQVRTDNVRTANLSGKRVRQERSLHTGLEVVICAPSALLLDSILERMSGGEAGGRGLPRKPSGAGASVARGQRYHRPPAGGSVTLPSRVFRYDPDAIDRGTNAHKRVQNQLADSVKARGWEPLSPSDADPLFDVAWVVADHAWIAEVKSLTAANEDRQLRLGLGQVLSYAHLVDWGVESNRPVVAVERQPSAPYWSELCRSHGVALSWPDVFGELLDTCEPCQAYEA